MSSLINITVTEWLKLKKAKILWILPTSVLIPNLLTFSMYAFNPKYPNVLWDDYFVLTEMMINMMVAIGLYNILTGYIFSREYQEGTVQYLFIYPYSRELFLIGKLLLLFCMILATIAASFLLTIITGLLLKHELLTWAIITKYLVVSLLMVILHFALVPIAASISIFRKHLVSTVIFSVSVMLLNLILVNTPLGIFFPWSIPNLFSPHENGRSIVNYPIGIATITATFVIGIFLCIKAIKKDVS
ncbi:MULTISPECIES: ABC transporter permease [Paenibacillus]|uniref:ABC transporter permease n=1 Tax=Paenibacillus TaxID=44249 RepID=UPI0022B89670|nr:ABC transporter permease [Paenibacillus caseinilyticus]MCZ8521073.1 ABC transporter permease [Paenibacillus caseinilyticus]